MRGVTVQDHEHWTPENLAAAHADDQCGSYDEWVGGQLYAVMVDGFAGPVVAGHRSPGSGPVWNAATWHTKHLPSLAKPAPHCEHRSR